MRRLIVVALLVGLATGAAYCYVNYNFEIRRGQAGLESITITPKEGSARGESSGGASAAGLPRLIRIATFNLGRLDQKKIEDPRVSAVLANVITRFDVVAVQEVRGGNRSLLMRLVEQINSAGREYDVITSGTAAPGAAGQYCAFLLNRSSIEIDRSTVQLVGDPQGRFRHRPLTALFRVKGPDPTEAFTFRLINVHTDPDRTDIEPDLLDDVFRAVRDDRLNEDDVILLGNLGAAGAGPTVWDETLEVASAISDTPTTISGTGPVDNIIFDPRATAEFTGRAGVLDLMRELELTWREVSEISDHLPVWAEFSSHEGGSPGHMAGRAAPKTR